MYIRIRTARKRLTCLVCYEPIKTREKYSNFGTAWRIFDVEAICHYANDGKCHLALTDFFYPEISAQQVIAYFHEHRAKQ